RSSDLLARLFYRQRNPLNAVGASALAILVWQPRALFDASFQLTFVSLLAIAGIAVPIFERTSQPLRRALRNFDSRDYDFALSPRLVQFRLDLRLVAERLARWLGQPLSPFVMIGAWRLVLAAYDTVLLWAVLAIAVAAATLVIAICALRWKKVVVAALLAFAAASVASCFSAGPRLRAGAAEITAIDVGQGDSLLVVSPAGRTLLIDAGGELGPPGAAHFDIGEEVVSSYLWARGFTRIDAVALTHAHADHIGG